jgi:hypothetical protein
MLVPPASTPKPSVIVYVPEGVVYVPCVLVAPSTTPLEPTRPAVSERTAFQPDAPFAQAVTVAYEPLDLTVMSWVASPGLAGTGKLGVAAAAVVCLVPVPPPALPPEVPAEGADALGEGFGDREAEADGDADADADALAERLGEADEAAPSAFTVS